MKKSLMIGIVLFSLLLVMPLVFGVEECDDSDGGKDYYVKGTCKDSSGNYTEYCAPDVFGLVEHWCENNVCANTPKPETDQIITPCEFGCQDGACLSEPEPEECAASISIVFDKDVYYTGDYAKFTVEVFDSQGNRIPNYSFYPAMYEYSTDHWDSASGPAMTNNEGYFEFGAVLGEGTSKGKILYKAYTKATESCPTEVEDSTETEFRAKEAEEEAEPVPTVCAAKIVITSDKEVYYVGDYIHLTQVILDSEGNPIPGYRFYILYYDFLNDKWVDGGSTSVGSDGYTKPRFKLEGDDPSLGFGKFKAKVYTKQIGSCDSVETTFEREVKGKKPVPCGIGTCVPEEEVEEVEVIPEDEVFYKCNGCELEGKCYPMGYRKEGKYCSDNNEFISQIDGKCDNSFECKSNVCVSGECVDEDLIKKIIKWFKKLFGGDENEGEEEPGLEMCSKLLLEKNIGAYKYVKSGYGGSEHTQAPLFSEDGEHMGVIKCCAVEYIHKEKDEVKSEEIKAAIVCPYNNREELRNSLIWILAKEGMPDAIEFNGQKVLGDMNDVIIWTHDTYIIASGGDPKSGTPIAEEVAKAYLKKYPSDLDITEDEIPYVPQLEKPESWVTCTSEKDMSREECHFTDDFESGLGKWTFSSGGIGDEGVGKVAVENGNTAMRIVGVERANVYRIWDNYLFKFRFKMIAGNVHVDFRRSEGYTDGARRYFVSMNYREVFGLEKQIGREWRSLEDMGTGIDNNWHTLEIRCYDDIINVYVDNKLVAKHKDTMNTFLSGWVRFEAHTGGSPGVIPELLIDDVEIKPITEEDIIYP